MIERLSRAKSSIQIFFPKKPLPGSLYARKRKLWVKKGGGGIRSELEALLKSTPSIVFGYQLTDGRGMWFNEAKSKWERDPCCEVQAWVSPGFVNDLTGTNLQSLPRQFLASIAQLSCVSMGHAGFMAIVERIEHTGSPQGFKIGDKTVPYATILGGLRGQEAGK